MEGREGNGSSKLSQLPLEIMIQVVRFLGDDRASLASLALVNSDYRYLARQHQFAKIRCDPKTFPEALWKRLKQEAKARLVGLEPQLSIGAHVRHLTILPYFNYMPTPIQEPSFTYWPSVACSELQREILGALAPAFPNLKRLSWRENGLVDGKFFRRLSSCTAREAELDIIVFDRLVLVRSLPPFIWPLRSLNLKLRERISLKPRSMKSRSSLSHAMSGLIANAFRAFAPTLRCLTWEDGSIASTSGQMDSESITFGAVPIMFPQLRRLRLRYHRLDASAFSSLLSSPLQHLELPARGYGTFGHCLLTCEPLEDLESLVVPQLPGGETCAQIARFIKRHKGIQKLYLREPQYTPNDSLKPELDQHMMPALENHDFRNLKSLCLGWSWRADCPSDEFIPEPALAAIGKMTSLEQLCLSVDRAPDGQNLLPANHDKIRDRLNGLTGLRKLAFGWNYDSQHDLELSIPVFYRPEGPRPDEWQPYYATGWMMCHREAMLKQAEAYAGVFEELEWVLCGQLPMEIERGADGWRAVLLSQELDGCDSLLDEVFGITPPAK